MSELAHRHVKNALDELKAAEAELDSANVALQRVLNAEDSCEDALEWIAENPTDAAE